MTPTQEELKLLAEWYFGKDKVEIDSDKNIVIVSDFIDWNKEKKKSYTKWLPNYDSNQLDMLEDKMIEEGKADQICYWFYDTVVIVKYICNSKMDDNVIEGKGSTKNEARLNAIINYIRNLK